MPPDVVEHNPFVHPFWWFEGRMSCHPPQKKKTAKNWLRFFVAPQGSEFQPWSHAATNSNPGDPPGIIDLFGQITTCGRPTPVESSRTGISPFGGIGANPGGLRFSVSGFSYRKCPDFLEIIQYFMSNNVKYIWIWPKNLASYTASNVSYPKDPIWPNCGSPKTIHLHSNPSAGRTWLKAFRFFGPRLPKKNLWMEKMPLCKTTLVYSALNNKKKNSRRIFEFFCTFFFAGKKVDRELWSWFLDIPRSCCVENLMKTVEKVMKTSDFQF